MGCVAENLEGHMGALDLEDENSKVEYDAYVRLAAAHREVAARDRSSAWWRSSRSCWCCSRTGWSSTDRCSARLPDRDHPDRSGALDSLAGLGYS
jgi:hypothetical protein